MDEMTQTKRVQKEVRELLLGSYREVLDAVKHQDDKIGRLFTGIAFLTAAALAMANLGSAKYLSQRYDDWWDAPPAMLSLAAYLLLVVMSVTILIGSLGTPLRVPGLSRTAPKNPVDWVGPRPSSQIYFGEISKLSLLQWQEKWTGDPEKLETELAQSLVGETHNLAARTQFKYGRMNEAIALFNLALLFLSITMIMCVASASRALTTDRARLPDAAQWALATAVCTFFFLQLLSQVRYTRQTIDEIVGRKNQVGGALRYAWVALASTWILCVGSGRLVDGHAALLLWLITASGIATLAAGTFLQRHLKGVKWREQKLQWVGPLLALVTGFSLTLLSTTSDERGYHFPYSFALALAAAIILTVLAVCSPSLNVYRNVLRFKESDGKNLAKQQS